jgi:predicted nucleic acid-binding protein
MILADATIWIDHLREANTHLIHLLERSEVVVHPAVIGELALRDIQNRELLLSLLDDLPSAPVATHDEVMAFVTAAHLYGRGLSLGDAQLLTSTRLAAECLLWTANGRLTAAAHSLSIGWQPRP